jgi:hypothetical protein
VYSTCTFCNKPLGENRVLEHFPVGRRIAFDPERGRLWVVCRSCERWNLSPIEERWEILEMCEREFRNTRIRTSTENIGLARLSEGLELVRIGSPMRPEFAAWRYGDQFGRRRYRAMLKIGGGLAGLGAVYMGLAAVGIGGGIFTFYYLTKAGGSVVKGNPRETVARLPLAGIESTAIRRTTLEIKRAELESVKLVANGHDKWGLLIPDGAKVHMLQDEHARNAARIILPAVNRMGGRRRDVNDAVSLLEQAGPERYVADVARKQGSGALPLLPYSVRLALEMATHEDAERRALEGELALLEEAWRAAEEIADISDRLLMPESFVEKIVSLGKKAP